ncbi:hypothetical protein NBT05_02585 [Aquimarina sp. ERC-38]|uniref:hypothetical protein n=1 Tax=Aquimarina sp. ERC-38 TaxID=2949996 RepID=UPI002247F443|nr:hypothetical protein [Aquimarina sp. ERC-38]UZO81369.1 hypothetical protein NBT05_02585 [Aquimarina sp. ERC-38]
MELHRLDGFDATGLDALDITDTVATYGIGTVEQPEIAYEILDDHGNVVMYADVDENIYVIDGLGGFFKKIGKGLKRFAKKVVKPVVKTFNRFLNPATILLRNGFLLAMKINMMKVAEKLRFGYLSESEARKRGGDMGRFAKMRKAVTKAEKIYELAGGKKENLKKAILRGKGNKDRKVPLSGFALGSPLDNGQPGVFNDPFEKFVVESDVDTVEAFIRDDLQVEGLSGVATGTAIAAASSAVAGVAAIVGKIGDIFGQAKSVKQQASSIFKKPKAQVAPARFSDPQIPRFPVRNFTPSPAGRTLPVPVISQNRSLLQNDPGSSQGKEGFFQKHKTPILIGAGLLVVGTGLAIAVRSGKKKRGRPISGTPVRRKSTRRKKQGVQRDALGRFTKGTKTRRKSRATRKAPEKLVPKALL